MSWFRVGGKRRSRAAHLIALLTLSFGGGFASAASNFSPVETDPGSGIKIELSLSLGGLPMSGWAPVRVAISNETGAAHTWEIDWRHRGSSQRLSHDSIRVEAHKQQVAELLVPIGLPEDPSRPYATLQAEVRGPGVTSGTANANNSYASNPATRWIVMSRALGLKSWQPLDANCTAHTLSLAGGQIDPTDWPVDRRAWFGVSEVWLTPGDWAAMAPAARDALLGWVTEGGLLFCCTPEENLAAALAPGGPAIPRTDGSVAGADWRLGLGDIEWVKATDDTLNPDQVREVITGTEWSTTGQLAKAAAGWPVPKEFAGAAMPKELMTIFILTFGILVGPVNLFLFAPHARRQRMFWTTPLLSVAAALLLLGLILFREGFGGIGTRVAVVVLAPDRQEQMVAQEQTTRTSLLLAREFTLAPETFMTAIPVNFDEGKDGATPNSWRMGNEVFENRGARWSGQWFASRMRQAHYLQRTEPTRARVELVSGRGDANEAPVAISSLPQTLAEFFYYDGTHWWHATDLAPGRRTTLSAQGRDWTAWKAEQHAAASSRLNGLCDRVHVARGTFFGHALGASPALIDTLPSIRWTSERTIYLGTISVTPPR